MKFSLALSAALVALSAGAALAVDRTKLADQAQRTCPQYGQGFAAVQGSSTCVRVSGRVRAEAGTRTRRYVPDREGAVSTNARLAIDARTETEYGPARAFVRFGSGTGRR